MNKRKRLPLLLAGILLLTGCGRGQVTDGSSMLSEVTTEIQITSAEPAVQTETAAEPIGTTAAPTTVPTAQTTTEMMTSATKTTSAATTLPAGAETAAHAPAGTYPFTAQYFRTDSRLEEARYPQCVCIDNASALNAYVSRAAQRYSLTGSGFSEAVRQYDDAWFVSHTLVIAVLEESSGSVHHTVTRVEKNASHAGTVEIERDVPEVGTCDMAYWHILIELPAGTFTSADTIEVVMQ